MKKWILFGFFLIFCGGCNIASAQEYRIIMTGNKSNAVLCLSTISPIIIIQNNLITFKVSGWGFSYKGQTVIQSDQSFDMETVVDLLGGKPSTFKIYGNLAKRYAVVTSSRSGCMWTSNW